MRAASPDPADLAACRALLREGSSSFHTAGLLLPRTVRDHAAALYAFCRIADDVADNDGRADRIAGLRARLAAAYAGAPRAHPVDRAFAAIVAQHDIPRDLPEALIEGLAWDVEGRTYETLQDLEAYAARVAGSVGAMMTVLMGVREPQALARACDLGVAMQLTNIARDVGEDARMGRLYLPRDWLRDAGIGPEAWLAAPTWEPALADVVAQLVAAAEGLYARAVAGIAYLPAACRPAIYAARLIYAEIGREVTAPHFDPLAQRAYVPTRRKLALVMQAGLRCYVSPRTAPQPPLDATRFLVSAAATATRSAGAENEGRIVWLLDLFERLERRSRV